MKKLLRLSQGLITTMTSNEAKFQFYFNIKQRTFLVEKYGTINKKELMQKIAEDILENTQTKIQTIDDKIKNERLTNLQYKNRIDKVRAEHYETFGKEPSPQANEAIKIGTRTTPKDVTTTYSKPITAKDFDVRNHGTLHQDQLNGHISKCRHCDYSSLPQDEQIQALAKLKEHVSIKHYSEVWK